MPNIKPISDLKNYEKVLSEVELNQPVFLTENGYGRYVILDLHDYNLIASKLKLSKELDKGRLAGEKEGWIDSCTMKEKLKEKWDI